MNYEINIEASYAQEIVDISSIDLIQKEVSAEKKVIKKDLYEKTSQEAKEVINLVLNTPSELIEIISTPKGKITKSKIKKYLLDKWKSQFLVELIMKEISRLVDNF